jgi:LysM repeat protein
MQAAFLVSAHYSGRTLLGSPPKHARPRLARRLPAAAAVPALFGAAAAFALASAPAAGASAAQIPAHQTATTAARPAAALDAFIRPAAKHTAAAKSAAPAKYTVKSGDTLSAIAERLYQSPAYWPVLYWANHSQIQYANVIQVGQVLTVPAKPASIPAPPSVLGPAPAPAPAQATPSVPSYQQTTDTSAPAYSAPSYSAPSYSAPVQSAPVQSSAVSTAGDSSFQSCVISRESGGNSQVMNSSGHYGLYQFSASTWAEYGGNPADFGNASVAQQNQVFDNAIAAGGQSNWAPYDGC